MRRTWIWIPMVALLLTAGCGEDEGTPPPEALAVETAPTTLEEAFADASGELKTLSDQAIALLRADNYPGALIILQRLAGRTDLTSDQRNLTGQAILTANQKVSEAAAGGDKDAQELQRYREFTK